MNAWALHGDPTPSVVAAGHSHVLCMLESLNRASRPGVAVAYNAELVDGPPLAPEYWQYVAEVAQGRTIIIVWNGNQHHAQFLVEPLPPISVWSARLGATTGKGTIVPRALLRALWEPTMTGLSEALALLPQSARPIVLATPPPKNDLIVSANLAVERWFEPEAQGRGVAIGDLPITAQATRLALWEIIQERLQEIAVSAGARFLGLPESVADDDGYLLPGLSGPDATHANADYGDLLWTHIESELLR